MRSFEKLRHFGPCMTQLLKKLTTAPSGMAILLLVGCAFLSVLIPPLKSPDEPDHIERAYLLAKGTWVLDRPAGKSSGGDIDIGLLDYMARYPVTEDKVTTEVIESAAQIRWTQERIYDPSPGTGYYFPIVYAPQATGLYLGEQLGLTVDQSYKLARAFALLACVLLIGAAFKIHAPNALTLALLFMPMTLFQFASASLDGMAAALAVLAISIFMRIAANKHKVPAWALPALAIVVVVLVTCKIHTLPFVFLLFAAWRYTPNKRGLILLLISGLFIVIWTGLAIKTTVDMRVGIAAPTSKIVAFYLQQPLQFLKLIGTTVSHDELGPFYVRSFLGVLGWLDTPFSPQAYSVLGYSLIAAVILASSCRGIRQQWRQRLLLVAVAVASILLIFLALLVTWTPHPANIILGIQGRYFLIPAIVLAYSLAGQPDNRPNWRQQLGRVLCLALFLFSVTASTQLLLNRYYLAPFQSPVELITHKPEPAGTSPGSLIASLPLQERQPIQLHMPSLPVLEFGQLRRIGIRFGTHARQNTGQAELRLRTQDGQTYSQIFSLTGLMDNNDYFFNLPPQDYINGEIHHVSGGGISTWEIHAPQAQVLTCMKFYYTFNKTVVMAGCP